jgi:HPt (histidine-containing phosphotransfer) domain-containing protein
MSAASGGLAGRRVLVVDADGARTQAVMAVLGSAGAAAETASAIHQALDLLEGAEPAFAGVIIGERLADADGVVLARAVRTSPFLYDLRLVILSAGAAPDGFDVACAWPATAASLAAALLDPPPMKESAPEGTAQILDLSELESIAGGLTVELTAMLRRFADQASKMAADAMAAASAADIAAAKGHAHALKGAAFSAGATRLGKAARSFEAAAATADWAAASSIDLPGEARALAEAIRALPEPTG